MINTKVIALCLALGLVGCSSDRGGMESDADTSYGTGSSITTNGGTMGSNALTNQGSGSLTNGYLHLNPRDTNGQAQPDSGAPNLDNETESGDSEDMEPIPDQEDQNNDIFEPMPPDGESAPPTFPDQDSNTP